MCSWPDCEIDDVDMLSLDHIANDGAKERREHHTRKSGAAAYRRLRNSGYPIGYQTLCWNHQWKKEIVRVRDNIIGKIDDTDRTNDNLRCV